MSERITKRQFVLNTLLPYKENPETCGYDNGCVYLTNDGKKCAVGKHMKEGEWQKETNLTVIQLNAKYGLSSFLTEEALEQKLTVNEWSSIQNYHDGIAYMSYGKLFFTNDLTFINTRVEDLEEIFDCEFPELKI